MSRLVICYGQRLEKSFDEKNFDRNKTHEGGKGCDKCEEYHRMVGDSVYRMALKKYGDSDIKDEL